jgi:hypothetical protein
MESSITSSPISTHYSTYSGMKIAVSILDIYLYSLYFTNMGGHHIIEPVSWPSSLPFVSIHVYV